MGNLEQSGGVHTKYASFIIESGHVAVLNAAGDIIDFLGAGNEMVQVDSLGSYSFEVLSNELRVMKFDRNTMEASQTSAALAKKEALLQLPTEQRVSQALLHLGMRHGAETGDPALLRFPKAINKGKLAQYTKLNPNTVTKVLKKLQVEGVIYNMSREMHIDIFELELKVAPISQ
ncbi:helix-turn-helix domain-containing protein [Listeria newyorkensis]|uniref:Crp/Fnr family transcriptional regulator n=1 Tax=Listeria newyorkensis TaxID=1497681 RepID=A0A841YX58_9LIST|nr:helix-turn-helix domain-containing protein [Listeria newyorkensis]MBC1457156.1 Crp/Fnr family transcriptional regulator [Listeria newyorkensis]